MRKIIAIVLIFSFLFPISPLPVMAGELEIEVEFVKRKTPLKKEKKGKVVPVVAAPVMDTKPFPVLAKEMEKEPAKLGLPAKKKRNNSWVGWVLVGSGVILALTIKPPAPTGSCPPGPGPGPDPD